MEEIKKKRPVFVSTVVYVARKEDVPEGMTFGTPGNYDLKFMGYFHQWGNEAEPDDQYNFGNFTVGIVEDQDGQVHTINPNHIKFLDR